MSLILYEIRVSGEKLWVNARLMREIVRQCASQERNCEAMRVSGEKLWDNARLMREIVRQCVCPHLRARAGGTWICWRCWFSLFFTIYFYSLLLLSIFAPPESAPNAQSPGREHLGEADGGADGGGSRRPRRHGARESRKTQWNIVRIYFLLFIKSYLSVKL